VARFELPCALLLLAGLLAAVGALAFAEEPANLPREASAHWAFRAPVRPAIPRVRAAAWCRDPIDRFVLSKIEAARLAPSPEADRAIWIRRVTFDLIGLPPEPTDIGAFLADESPDAFERVVDRLLASPHFGERMGVVWLDAARYADTHGYHIDSHREMWRWRDWVIESLNADMPFDRFTTLQMAGDLLPKPTLEDRIATGFHRNHMINFEDGAIPEEYRQQYVADRTATMATVWMGLTMQCARCHDHKYDPISQSDFYRLSAFFNNLAEQGLDGKQGNAAPLVRTPTRLQETKLAALDAELQKRVLAKAGRIAAAEKLVANFEADVAQGKVKLKGPPADMAGFWPLDDEGETTANLVSARSPGKISGEPNRFAGKFNGALGCSANVRVDLGPLPKRGPIPAFSIALWVNRSSDERMTILCQREKDPPNAGWELGLEKGKLVFQADRDPEKERLEIASTQSLVKNRWQHVALVDDGNEKARQITLYIDGERAEIEVVSDTLPKHVAPATSLQLAGGGRFEQFRGLLDEVRLYPRALSAAEIALVAKANPIQAILTLPPAQRSPAQKGLLRQYFLEQHDADYRRISEGLVVLERAKAEMEKDIPSTMILEEQPQPRETFVLEQGDYQKPGERVSPRTPGALPPLRRAGARASRLDLAKWLLAPEHPLTARVAVNRIWQTIFDAGLVRTPEDFGTRGQKPTHPELLDYLAVEYRESGWQSKRLIRRLVLSATYRQASVSSGELVARDPENRLLARMQRRRLPAEMIRDASLAASGLLALQQGGRSFYPYQSPELWREVAFRNYTAQEYVASTGADLYRRSLYAFWKRAVPPATLAALDAPDREVCSLTRSPSNTPLTALALWNDPGFIEAARFLGQGALELPVEYNQQRLAWMVRRVLGRSPDREETLQLLGLFDRQWSKFRKSPELAAKLLKVGDSPANPRLDPAQHAAWTIVASAILHLDEAITRE